MYYSAEQAIRAALRHQNSGPTLGMRAFSLANTQSNDNHIGTHPPELRPRVDGSEAGASCTAVAKHSRGASPGMLP